MNKRGVGGHVDWVIGIGLFLVYVALIFAFFKPGIEEVFQSDTLLDIVETNFRTTSMWNVTRTPLFLTPMDYECWVNAEATSMSSVAYDGRVSYFRLQGLWNDEGFSEPGFVTDFAGDYELFYVPSTDAEESDVCGNYMDMTSNPAEPLSLITYDSCSALAPTAWQRPFSLHATDDNGLTIPASIPVSSSDTLKYLLISAPTSDVDLDAPSPGGLPALVDQCDGDDAGNLQSSFLGCRIDETTQTYDTGFSTAPDGETCAVEYSIGVSETLLGLQSALFSGSDLSGAISSYLSENYDDLFTLCPDLSATENSVYTCLKTVWGYPPLKEFQIVISYDDAGGNPATTSFPSTPPPYNVRVDSRFYHDFILTPDGLRFPAEVNILVW